MRRDPPDYQKLARALIEIAKSMTEAEHRELLASREEASGSPTPSPDAQAVVDACRTIGDVAGFSAPAGYPDGLALCILDSIWSMGVRYGSVENVVDRYRAWVRSQDADPERRSAFDLILDIETSGGPDAFGDKVLRNRQLTSTRSGVRKSIAAHEAARSLLALGVDSTRDLRVRATDSTVKKAWLNVHGQRSGISWYYLTMLAHVEDVKPDRMIQRFVTRATGRPVRSGEARQLLTDAHQALRRDAPGLTLRALDHVLWTHERSSRSR